MSGALGRALLVDAILRSVWWAWVWLALPWWHHVDRYAAALAASPWSAVLKADNHTDLLILCLIRPTCSRALTIHAAHLTPPPAHAWLALVLVVGLLVVAWQLTRQRSGALDMEPSGEALRRPIRRG